MVTQKWCLSVDIKTVSVDITFARFPPTSHFGPVFPSCQRPSAKRRRRGGHRRTQSRIRRTLLDAGRGRVLESKWVDLVAAAALARAVSWPHWRLRCMQPLHGHGMGVVRPWSLSCGDPSACHACSMCSAPALRLLCLAFDLLEALDRCVCTRRTCCFCLCCHAQTNTLLSSLMPLCASSMRHRCCPSSSTSLPSRRRWRLI